MADTRRLGMAVATVAVLAMAGCATTPVPEVAAARALVGQAEQQDTQQYASADLESARSKLRQAADFEKNGKPVLAEQTAKESEADAEVAMARTRAIKAEKDLNDVNAGTQTLRNESQRQQGQGAAYGTTPPAPGNGTVTMPDSTPR